MWKSKRPAAPDPAQPTEAPPDDGKPQNGIDAALSGLNRGHAYLIAVTAGLTAVVNLEVFVERQWQLALVTGLLGMIGGSAYIVADRRRRVYGRGSAPFVRRCAIGVLSLTVPVTLIACFALTSWGRFVEDGPIIAVARFDGPDLPAPYNDCRPSDMLADTMADVQQRFRHLNVFELPYVVDPNGRWGQNIAAMHGMVEGADVVIFGEYSLVDNSAGSIRPDRLLISPVVDKVPMLSLGWKMAPLLQWDFPTRVVWIDQLCTGNSERFLNDGHRLALAVAGIGLLAEQRYIGAQAALNEAETLILDDAALLTNHASQDRRASRCDQKPTPRTECSGILAFYLAVLNQRLGNNKRAEHEYIYAAQKLNKPAPYINLGELYVLEGNGEAAIRAFRLAMAADPYSVSALATLSQYEYQYGDRDQATNDLRRAESSPKTNLYDTLALSRALFARSDENDNERAIAMLEHAIHPGFFGARLPKELEVDSEVDYGRWLLHGRNSRTDEAIAALEDAVKESPIHIKANYELGLALGIKRTRVANMSQQDRAQYHELMQRHFLTAIAAPAFTADNLTDQANAASELGQTGLALRLYSAAIGKDRYAYAYSGRGNVYIRMHQYAKALQDFTVAVSLHPREKQLQEQIRLLARTSRRPGLNNTNGQKISEVVR